VKANRHQPVSLSSVADGQRGAFAVPDVLSQQDYAEFRRLFGIADARAGFCAAEPGVRPIVKQSGFDEAHFCRPQHGIALAGKCELVPFHRRTILRPEPTWLSPPARALPRTGGRRPRATFWAATGISLQWGASWVDALGRSHAWMWTRPNIRCTRADAGGRRQDRGHEHGLSEDALGAVGGFRPGVSVLIGRDDLETCARRWRARSPAVVPLAQWHHGFAERAVYAGTDRRAGAACVRDLVQGTAVFCARHGLGGRCAAGCFADRRQRRRLLRLWYPAQSDATMLRRFMQRFRRG